MLCLIDHSDRVVMVTPKERCSLFGVWTWVEDVFELSFRQGRIASVGCHSFSMPMRIAQDTSWAIWTRLGTHPTLKTFVSWIVWLSQ